MWYYKCMTKKCSLNKLIVRYGRSEPELPTCSECFKAYKKEKLIEDIDM